MTHQQVAVSQVPDFEFDQSDSMAGWIKFLAVRFLVIGEVIIVGAYAAGFSTGEEAVMMVIFIPVLFALSAWNM